MKHGCPSKTALTGQAKPACPKDDVELGRAWEKQRLVSQIAELTTQIGWVEQRQNGRRKKLKAEMDISAADISDGAGQGGKQ